MLTLSFSRSRMGWGHSGLQGTRKINRTLKEDQEGTGTLFGTRPRHNKPGCIVALMTSRLVLVRGGVVVVVVVVAAAAAVVVVVGGGGGAAASSSSSSCSSRGSGFKVSIFKKRNYTSQLCKSPIITTKSHELSTKGKGTNDVMMLRKSNS